jgi:hypothetical protein
MAATSASMMVRKLRKHDPSKPSSEGRSAQARSRAQASTQVTSVGRGHSQPFICVALQPCGCPAAADSDSRGSSSTYSDDESLKVSPTR